MGVILFIIALIIELVLAVYCIYTKNNQKKVRGITRITVFLGFIGFTALSIIDWSFRYYALAAFLALSAIFGFIGFIRKNKETKTYKPVRVVLKAVGMTILIFVFTMPAILFPQNTATIKTTGEYQVAAVQYTYTDSSRAETYTNTGESRKLNVEMWYPEAAANTYPLIVFSHGSFGIKTSNESLYNELASHGYVVCSIDHTYQCFSTTDDNGHTIYMDMGYMQEIGSENAHLNKQQSYEYYKKWMNIRTGDINFVIDYILDEAGNNNADKVYRLVNAAKIGVMGHSLGGSAALGIGRSRDDVSAVISLEAPFMCDIIGVENNEFVFTDKIYPVPVLNVYSDNGKKILAEKSPQYAANCTLLSDTGTTAFNVFINGAGHLNLTDLALTSPILTNIFNGFKSATDTEYCLKTINKVCLEFFDCYLKTTGEFTSDGTY